MPDIDEWMPQYFPFSNFRKIGKGADVDVLIAGCGTGQHSIIFAQVFSGARILAVDLSMASLCYAKQKTRVLGIHNIEYAQADILELSRLDKRFDIISSSGVLHQPRATTSRIRSAPGKSLHRFTHATKNALVSSVS
jgi:ubiquinone/menaquinone biosynthesis C-methylase UbiE